MQHYLTVLVLSSTGERGVPNNDLGCSTALQQLQIMMLAGLESSTEACTSTCLSTFVVHIKACLRGMSRCQLTAKERLAIASLAYTWQLLCSGTIAC